jgi:acylphosphatase
MEKKTMRFLVTGRVQGVWFRATARQQARLFGVSGWVRNRADGAVEGMAQGTPAALREFRTWLGRGPANARVLKVEWEEVKDAEAFDGFEIR